jgi:hypothetical protein
MDQYRTYLRAELGKLGNAGDSRAFLERSGCPPEAFNLVGDPEWLARSFASQDQVDEYVAGLSPVALKDLTACCGRWRGNGIAAKLSQWQTPMFIEVPVENILLSQAEETLGHVFREHSERLSAIAQDARVLAADAYCRHKPGDHVSFRVCLAKPVSDTDGMYRVFDGMHRAIQMLRNRDAQIPLCVVDDP